MSGAYDVWLARLRSGALGQSEGRPSTWVLDDVWRAACNEVTDREQAAIVKRDAQESDAVLALVKRVKSDMRGVP